MRTGVLAGRRCLSSLAYVALAIAIFLPVSFAFARGGHGGGGHGGGGHFGGGHAGGIGHAIGGAHFSGEHPLGVGHVGDGYAHVGSVVRAGGGYAVGNAHAYIGYSGGGRVGDGHALSGQHGYVGHSPGGYIGGSRITSTPRVDSGHVSARGQLNRSGTGNLRNGSHFVGAGTSASTGALSSHNFAATSRHGGINPDHHHHNGFHHHHNFFFFPFAFGAFYSAYPYYYGYPYAYGSPYGYGGDPCDPYSPYYDPAYCDWLYSQGYYGNGSMYQPDPSTLPPQQNGYLQQQWNDPNKNTVGSAANTSAAMALQTLVSQNGSDEDVDLDEPGDYAASIPVPLVGATSAPEALPPQRAQDK